MKRCSHFICSSSRMFLGLFLLHIITFNAQSQTYKNQLNLFAGSQGIACQKIWNGSVMDFLNYIEAEGYSESYLFIGALWHYELNDKLEGRIMVSMQSDMAPALLNVSSSYYFRKRLGVGISFFGYPETISNFHLFHQNNDVGMSDFNSNSRYRRVYSMGFALGPDYKFRYRFVNFNLRLHSGVRWIRPFSEGFIQKQVNGNYIRTIEYHTRTSPSLFFYPQAELGLQLFRVDNVYVGFKMKVFLELSQRTINYSRSISEWVYEPYTQTITTQNHSYRKIDYDFGLNFSW